MKEIELNRGYIALVDDEDYEKVNKYKWHVSKHKDRENLYAKRAPLKSDNSSSHIMHRFVMGLEDGQGRSIQVDHINKNSLDNQKLNLRVVTASQNSMNKRKIKPLTSVYKGVYWCKNTRKLKSGEVKIDEFWRAQIRRPLGKLVELGCFEYEEDAALAYDMAALDIHEEFTCFNEL